MDDNLSALLNSHNSFGLGQDTISQDLLLLDPSKLGEAVPDFISDHGTSNSPMSSTLITPTYSLSGAFVFPPSHPYQTPFPLPPQPDTYMPFVSQDFHAPPPYLPTSGPVPQAIANHEFASQSTLPFAMPYTVALPRSGFPVDDGDTLDPLPYGWSHLPHLENCEVGISNGKDAPSTGPKRVKRSRKRQAPYRIDKDHEGAEKKYTVSQQAFLSETPGYGYNNVPKCTTKSRSKTKVTHPHYTLTSSPATTSAGPSTDAPPEANNIRAIRSHAKSKKRDPSRVQLPL